MMDPIKLHRRRTFHVIKKYGLVRDGDRIFVALSGGKDSAAALYAIKRYSDEKEVRCEVHGFHMDFGLPFSEKVLSVVRKQVEIVGCDLKLLNFKEKRVSIRELARRTRRPVCGVCGVVKRYFMNKFPREMGANKIATGHNMDDFIVFFMKNMLSQNIQWSAKFVPLLSGSGKALTKIRPLFEVGERENEALCEMAGIPFTKEKLCPYAFERGRKGRTRWYKTIYEIEEWQKNFRLLMIRGIAKISEKLGEHLGGFRECKTCGEPTSQEVCSFCRMMRKRF